MFEIGQSVKLNLEPIRGTRKHCFNDWEEHEGEVGVIVDVYYERNYRRDRYPFNETTYRVQWKNGSHSNELTKELLTIPHEQNKVEETKMNLIDKFLLNLTAEPEKTFIKLGITDRTGMLTGDGKTLYDAWKLSKDKQAFYEEVAKPMLEEQEKETK